MPQNEFKAQPLKATKRLEDDFSSLKPNSLSSSHDVDHIIQHERKSLQHGTVAILSRGPHHILAIKPPSVMCHHSTWIGTRRKKSKQNKNEVPEIPMLQRVRDAVHHLDAKAEKIMKRKVNLVHRLDRGASGVLLFAFADEVYEDEEVKAVEQMKDVEYDEIEQSVSSDKNMRKGPTAVLSEAMSQSSSTKTYIALVRGEGVLRGVNLIEKGWFEVNRPIKDRKGKIHDATTLFRFIAGQKENSECPLQTPRMSLVLARPHQGRWHQIRRHLNGLSHHIIGDGCHGDSKTNKEWKERRNLPNERILLHLSRLQICPTDFTPDGIDCICPLPEDMRYILNTYAPDLLEEALPVLKSEGIDLNFNNDESFIHGTYCIIHQT